MMFAIIVTLTVLLGLSLIWNVFLWTDASELRVDLTSHRNRVTYVEELHEKEKARVRDNNLELIRRNGEIAELQKRLALVIRVGDLSIPLECE